MGVVGKFVEFFGPGVAHLSIADRATIANMCPEYGATVGYFPVDDASLDYLKQTGKYLQPEIYSRNSIIQTSGLYKPILCPPNNYF